MTDDTTWSTDEVERWIDNDYNLYRLVTGQGAWMDHDEMQGMLLDIDWQQYNPDIKLDDIDFDYLADLYTEPEQPEPVRTLQPDIIVYHTEGGDK